MFVLGILELGKWGPPNGCSAPLSRDELSLHPLSTGGVPQIFHLMQGIWR